MFYKDSNNNKYYLGRAFNYGDIQYGAGAATAAKFTELGFSQVTVGARPDDRFYIVSGPDVNGNYSSTARDLVQLKINYIRAEKQLAAETLKPTDWYIIRNQEAGTGIPASYTNYRAAVRTASSARCTAIANAADVAALQTLITESTEIEDVSNPGTMIQNPAGLTAYPAVVDEDASITADYGL